MNDNEELRREARKRLKARSGFWSYIGVWGAVSLLLTAIWVIATPGEYFWPVWPVWAIFGMGVAVLFVGLDAYGPGPRDHSEADVDAEIERMTGHPISQNPPHRDDPML